MLDHLQCLIVEIWQTALCICSHCSVVDSMLSARMPSWSNHGELASVEPGRLVARLDCLTAYYAETGINGRNERWKKHALSTLPES